MNNFPSICIDNFLAEPDSIREFALKLDYLPSEDGSYSGLRSTPIHHVNLNLLTIECKRLLSCFYDLRGTPITWEVTSYFYKLLPGDEESTKIKMPSGNMLDCVVFLNPETKAHGGLSTYEQVDGNFEETAQFPHRYNRLVGVDGSNFTKDLGVDATEDFKLVQVFHIKTVISQYLPLPRMREQVQGSSLV